MYLPYVVVTTTEKIIITLVKSKTHRHRSTYKILSDEDNLLKVFDMKVLKIREYL